MVRRAVVTLGDRIRAARLAKKMSQLALATAAGVRPEVVSRIETGQSAASLASLHKIAPVLGLSLDELLKKDGPPLAKTSPAKKTQKGTSK